MAVREERKKALEAMMADGALFSDPQRAKDLSTEYETLKQDLKGRYIEWSKFGGSDGSVKRDGVNVEVTLQ